VFVGKSQRKLDDKGRIALPAALRDELQGLGYITVTDDNLSIFTEDDFRAFADDLEARVKARGEVPRVVLRKLFADTQRLRADTQGRITLPADLLEAAGIGSGAGTEVVVNGAMDRIEIWAPSTWDQLSDEGNEALKDFMRGESS
jgi:MraZ protein